MAKRRRKTPLPTSRPRLPSADSAGSGTGKSSSRQHSGHGPRAKPSRKSLPPRKTKSKSAQSSALTAAPVQNPLEPLFRIGHGYDLHRLEPLAPEGAGRPFIVGGVLIGGTSFSKGPVAHSDGDVLLHALTDALLGALGQDDIGQLFPDNAPENASRNSADFVREAVKRVAAAGYRISNLDCTIILERPKLAPHKKAIKAKLAALLGVPVAMVNLKGKTHEKVDAVGESRAVEAHIVVLLARVAI